MHDYSVCCEGGAMVGPIAVSGVRYRNVRLAGEGGELPIRRVKRCKMGRIREISEGAGVCLVQRHPPNPCWVVLVLENMDKELRSEFIGPAHL